jgi:hypothetical protein
MTWVVHIEDELVLRIVGEVGYHATLSRWSSRVRVPYSPQVVFETTNCESSSFGRAQPCQSRGCRILLDLPLKNTSIS